MDSQTDAELIRGLLAREESAYRQAVRAYHAGMIRFARSMVGDADAEEVVQETWVAVLKGLSEFAGRSSLKTWIYGILGNQAKTRLRRESRTPAVANSTPADGGGQFVPAERFDDSGHWTDPPVPWHEDSPEALLSSEDLRRCLERMLARMSPAQRQVLTLRDAEGMGMDEICNILGISGTNGRVLLHRARNLLRGGVERHERGQPC
jgi:RNA polymerase sigma-70 factor (ECF subfamily)